MSGSVSPLPNTPSWRGVRLKKAQGHLYLFTFYEFVMVYIFYVMASILLQKSNNPLSTYSFVFLENIIQSHPHRLQ
jgi:hypothetical protein